MGKYPQTLPLNVDMKMNCCAATTKIMSLSPVRDSISDPQRSVAQRPQKNGRQPHSMKQFFGFQYHSGHHTSHFFYLITFLENSLENIFNRLADCHIRVVTGKGGFLTT